MRILVLQHISCEPPAAYEDVLRDANVDIHRVELDEGEPLPPRWQAYDGIIAMGGPMSVNDEQALPWLVEEKRFIGAAVRAGLPFWGACLGSQLLASSLGARVYRGASPEVGVLPVQLTAAARTDPVFAAAPQSLLTLQWHNDTFDLPEGAVLLARSPLYEGQGFRWGDAAYAVQFHLEVSGDMAREWAKVPIYARDLEAVLGPGALPALIARLDEVGSTMNDHARTMFRAWMAIASTKAA
jgi:GMP synthase (glutamine-hydrolysing)